MQDFYKICLEKQSGKNNYTWDDIYLLFKDKYYFKSGEHCRDIWKKYRKKNGLLGVDKLTKILVISDLHIPFQLDSLLDILKDYKSKVDILHLNGDIQDCQGISGFLKKYRVPFVDETIQARQFIVDCINIIKPKKVIFNYGNHCKRLINYMSDKINDDLLTLMPDTNLELIIENGFYNKDRINGTKTFYEPLNNVYNNLEYTHNWYNQIGDVVFCHPSAYKSAILKTSQDAWLHFIQRKFNFNTLICSHTHASGIYKYGDGFIVETGSLCKEMDYIKEGKLLRPQSNGMFYCVLENDKFCFEKSKLIVI